MDLTRTLPSGTQEMITSGGIFMLSVLIVLIIIISKRWQARMAPMLCGIVACALFTYVFTNLIMSALALIPNIDVAFNNKTNYTIIYYVFETVGYLIGSFCVVYLLNTRFERFGDVVLAGLSMGAGQCILYGLSLVSQVVLCMDINENGLASAFSGMSESDAQTYYNSIVSLFDTPPYVWFLISVSMTITAVACAALMIIMFGVLKKKLPPVWVCFTGIAYFAIAISFQMYDANNMLSVIISITLKILLTAGLIFGVYRYVNGRIEYDKN